MPDLTLYCTSDGSPTQYATAPIKVWPDVVINGITRTVFACPASGHAFLGSRRWLEDSAGNRWPIVATLGQEVDGFTDDSTGSYPGVDAGIVLCDCHLGPAAPTVVPVHDGASGITGARAITGVAEWGTGNVGYYNQGGTATEFGYTATSGSNPSSGQLVVEGDPANPTSIVGCAGYYYVSSTRRGPSAKYLLSILDAWDLATLTSWFNAQGGDPWFDTGELDELRCTPGNRWGGAIGYLDDGINSTLYRGETNVGTIADIVVTNTSGSARSLTGLTLARRETLPFPQRVDIGADQHDLTGLTEFTFPSPYTIEAGATLDLAFVATSGGALFWSELALTSAAVEAPPAPGGSAYVINLGGGGALVLAPVA